MVIVPFLLIGVYFGVIASSRYVSESKIMVRQSGGGQNVSSLAISILTGGGSSSREDNLYLREYILSLDMLKYLDSSLALREAYKERGDYFSRLLPWASQEAFLGYYRKHLSVNFDSVAGVLTVRTEAFDPEFACRLNMEIMRRCEKFINESSHRIANEQLGFISGELTRANQELQAAKQKVLAFQNHHNVLDPIEQAKALSTFVLQMEAEAGRQEAELRHMRTFLAEGSTQIVSFREKLKAFKQQLQEEKQKISGGQGGKLNNISSEFMLLQFQAEFALDKYKVTLAAYEKERVETSRKVKNLVVISSPHPQEEAEYPRRGYIIVTALVGLLMFYGISQLIIATIEDHKD